MAKLMTTKDLDKWKKKFQMIFTSNRATLDLSLNPAQPVSIKNITLNPQSREKVGKRILTTNQKFWVVYIHYIADLLNDFAKATLRSRLFGDPETGTLGVFLPSNPEYEDLFREIGPLIDAEKLAHPPI
jgi:hypothetical protein